MRFESLALSVAVVLCAACSVDAQGVDFDPRAATSNLARSVTEDYHRQRARQIRREKEERALDFSPSSVPADSEKASVGNGEIMCTTIGLGDGDSVTTCR